MIGLQNGLQKRVIPPNWMIVMLLMLRLYEISRISLIVREAFSGPANFSMHLGGKQD